MDSPKTVPPYSMEVTLRHSLWQFGVMKKLHVKSWSDIQMLPEYLLVYLIFPRKRQEDIPPMHLAATPRASLVETTNP